MLVTFLVVAYSLCSSMLLILNKVNHAATCLPENGRPRAAHIHHSGMHRQLLLMPTFHNYQSTCVTPAQYTM